MESFISSLKTERTARKTYRTRSEAKADVFDYIERSVFALIDATTVASIAIEFRRGDDDRFP